MEEHGISDVITTNGCMYSEKNEGKVNEEIYIKMDPFLHLFSTFFFHFLHSFQDSNGA